MSKLPEGWFNSGDIASYRALVEQYVPISGMVVEVGTYHGRSICSIADVLIEHGAAAVTIDPYRWAGPDHGRGMERFEEVVRAIADHDIGSRVEVVKGLSAEVAADWDGRDVNLLFLDGDHRFEAVLTDIYAWLPHMASSGCLAGHDYMKTSGASYPYCDVAAALHRAAPGSEPQKLRPRCSVWCLPVAGTAWAPPPRWLEAVDLDTDEWIDFENAALDGIWNGGACG